MATYSIISVNTNGYDKAYNNADANSKENILFTDRDHHVTGWKQVRCTTDKEHPFNDVFKYRWNMLNYVDTDYVVWVDGSKEVAGTFKPLIDEMERTGTDVMVINHPARNNVYDEYRAWCKYRNYDEIKAFSWLSYMHESGVGIRHSGLVEAGCFIMKRTKLAEAFSKNVWKELHHFDDKNAERLDQTVVSFVLAKMRGLNVLRKTWASFNFLRGHWNHPMK